MFYDRHFLLHNNGEHNNNVKKYDKKKQRNKKHYLYIPAHLKWMCVCVRCAPVFVLFRIFRLPINFRLSYVSSYCKLLLFFQIHFVYIYEIVLFQWNSYCFVKNIRVDREQIAFMLNYSKLILFEKLFKFHSISYFFEFIIILILYMEQIIGCSNVHLENITLLLWTKAVII